MQRVEAVALLLISLLPTPILEPGDDTEWTEWWHPDEEDSEAKGTTESDAGRAHVVSTAPPQLNSLLRSCSRCSAELLRHLAVCPRR